VNNIAGAGARQHYLVVVAIHLLLHPIIRLILTIHVERLTFSVPARHVELQSVGQTAVLSPTRSLVPAPHVIPRQITPFDSRVKTEDAP
jgi:hypothetical protein